MKRNEKMTNAQAVHLASATTKMPIRASREHFTSTSRTSPKQTNKVGDEDAQKPWVLWSVKWYSPAHSVASKSTPSY